VGEFKVGLKQFGSDRPDTGAGQPVASTGLSGNSGSSAGEQNEMVVKESELHDWWRKPAVGAGVRCAVRILPCRRRCVHRNFLRRGLKEPTGQIHGWMIELFKLTYRVAVMGSLPPVPAH